MTVYSEPGLGTRFLIYLPRGDAGATTAASVSDPGCVVGGDAAVLLVEDNAQLRRAASRQLSELGYRVREANNATAALVVLSGDEAVDLLFTDLVMPGRMSGLDLALRAVKLRPGLRVLLTSGFPAVRGMDERMETCPFMLLNKPYRRVELARAVRAVLDREDAALIVAGGKQA
jgi:DNA-binding NtrC family response regulator